MLALDFGALPATHVRLLCSVSLHPSTLPDSSIKPLHCIGLDLLGAKEDLYRWFVCNLEHVKQR